MSKCFLNYFKCNVALEKILFFTKFIPWNFFIGIKFDTSLNHLTQSIRWEDRLAGFELTLHLAWILLHAVYFATYTLKNCKKMQKKFTRSFILLHWVNNDQLFKKHTSKIPAHMSFGEIIPCLFPFILAD